MTDSPSRYPAIADYALIGDCHSAALISRRGSVDWCCMPRFDSDSCFGRLLDWDKGGHFTICPRGDPVDTTRHYVSGTMILETHFRTPSGEARLLDFFAMDDEAPELAHYRLVRLVEGVSGRVEFDIEVTPRFDFGEIVPHVRDHGDGTYTATGSNIGLVIRSDTPFAVDRDRGLTGSFAIDAGKRISLSIGFAPPEQIDDRPPPRASEPDADTAFERTRAWWREWASHVQHPCGPDEQTLRSAIVLKSLSFERSGAIIAAPTTSLPECMGGERNWDYRFSWVRDSVFTVRALYELGCEPEADRFLRFVQRSAAGSATEMQIMYAVDGKRRLTELELGWMEGYRGSRPVRIGNYASEQTQLDIYGEILEMAWEWHITGHALDAQYWEFLSDVIDTACVKWQEKDHGIWEFRGEPRHFVHSKAMCWGALDHGLRLAQEKGLSAPIERWTQSRDAIRDAIEREGYDDRRGIFVQAFGSGDVDAALLLLPRTGFVAYDDPRMARTTDAIRLQLDRNGLLARYDSPDGLPGREGAFVPCTFWLVRCLAYQGRGELAWDYYRRALGCANELGLFSEEFDAESGAMLGNFPQALTHVSQITARLALEKARAAIEQH
ncbi:glycoside hydrolase family 15 protein [Herbaspirillum sp. HC18]|nr:glycoside hydrolase family 15 protein [Herbaspirillum sp. HC18]